MRIVAAALFALTAVLVGFAHRPLESFAPYDVASWVLPDGTLPDLCHVDFDDPSAPVPGHGATAVCDACLLTSAPGLGAVAGVVLPVAAGRMPVPEIARAQMAAGEPTRAPSSRGPPAVA